MSIEPNRMGKISEYKIGHYYLTTTEWEDGHYEVEIHRCMPELLFHSCDRKKLPVAEKLLEIVSGMEREQAPELIQRLEASIEKEQEVKLLEREVPE